ncbi:hypothetical protein SAMN05444166_6857 [Singulisphaera sp. GP187]|uniref:hypothetical protein n=1 Tax=Singulisphaera sp. GP187 TaxID=1882752 RepID=UPI00092916C1|nr:hypothetical protein [Singulisphaera sp. GP187]SIO61790.1 hypothetical protein SAMN05444166_6857 [Singulisphaera sp. GP187]
MDVFESEAAFDDSVQGYEAGTGHSGSTMSAAEALEKLKRGEPIERTRVVGLTLKGEFTEPVRFSKVTLVRFSIEKATFAQEVGFEHCTLERPRFSRKSQFEKGLSLTGSTLIKADLRGITVKGVFRCDNLRTRGRFLIEAARFEGRLRFWEAQFQGWVELKGSEFVDEVDFRSIHVAEGFVISGCQFRSNVLFRGASVQKKWQAESTRFEGMLDFSKAKLHDFVYLEAIEQGETQRFAFTNALAERILIRPEQLVGRLASEAAGDHAQAMQEYGLLKRIFEGLHRYEEEDWAFYRFKVNQRLSKKRTWWRPWTKVACCADWLLLDHGCGYGTNPFRAVRTALAIIFGFALIYALDVGSLHTDHAPFAGDQSTLANRLMIGTLTSVSAFTSGFGDIRGAASGWINLPLIAESLMGTLLWGLFIVAFSRKVIR